MEYNWRIGVPLRAEINKENWFITTQKKKKKFEYIISSKGVFNKIIANFGIGILRSTGQCHTNGKLKP